MESYLKATEEFNKKIEELKKENQPALNEDNLKQIVIYQKLLEIEARIARLESK